MISKDTSEWALTFRNLQGIYMARNAAISILHHEFEKIKAAAVKVLSSSPNDKLLSLFLQSSESMEDGSSAYYRMKHFVAASDNAYADFDHICTIAHPDSEKCKAAYATTVEALQIKFVEMSEREVFATTTRVEILCERYSVSRAITLFEHQGAAAFTEAMIKIEAALTNAMNSADDADCSLKKEFRKKIKNDSDRFKREQELLVANAAVRSCKKDLELLGVVIVVLIVGHSPELALFSICTEILEAIGCSFFDSKRILDDYTKEEWTAKTKPKSNPRTVIRRSFEGRQCVINLLQLSDIDQLTDFVSRILLLAKVDHMNVASLYTLFFSDNQMAYIETPFYINGRLDLFLAGLERQVPRLLDPHYLVQDRFSVKFFFGAARALYQLALGLEAIHAVNATHGDVQQVLTFVEI